jgi:hypothetical protein
MKLLVNVTGLKKIVFNQSVVYKLREQNGNKYWERTDGGGKRDNCYVTYDKMCANLWALGLDPENDAWVHGDTFNVKTQAKMKVKAKPNKPKNKKKSKNNGLDSTELISKAIKALAAVDVTTELFHSKKGNPPKEISFRGNPKTKWKQA